MNETDSTAIQEEVTIFQIFLVILSVYVLCALYVVMTFDLDSATEILINRVDFLVCLVFQADFFYRLHKAPSKAKFLRWGWIDFISSIPWFGSARGARMVRVVRVTMLLRSFRSIKTLGRFLWRDRSKNAFLGVAAVSFFLCLCGSMAILHFEKDAKGANISSAEDSLWWSIVTVTTIGYGDKYPVTPEGRVVAAILMTAGVGLFGTFTGFIASVFVEPDMKREKNEIKELVSELRLLREEMRVIDKKVTRTQRKIHQSINQTSGAGQEAAQPSSKPEE